MPCELEEKLSLMRVGIQSTTYDPEKSKMLDHKKQYVKRVGKETKFNRKEHYRSFRRKDNAFCRKIVMLRDEHLDNFDISEPVIKKTSGQLTW